MERRQARGSIDELATVKAAAWSWYQRGSGSGRERPETEYCSMARTRGCPSRPSRYKLEAMNYSSASPGQSEVRSNSRLLDAYEIERISRQLESYKEARKLEENNGFLDYGEPRASGVKTKEKQRRKIRLGFWQRHAVAVCGSSINDAVEISAGRPPEKHVGVVCVANCRPGPVIPRRGW